MKSYKTLEPMQCNGESIAVGGSVNLTDAQAEPLLALNHIEAGSEIKQPELSEEEKLAAVKLAIPTLNLDTAANWLKDGRPQASALSAIVNFDVNAALRDEAWAEVKLVEQSKTPASPEAAPAEAAPAEAAKTSGQEEAK